MIINKDRFPDAEWVAEIRIIGDVGGVSLALVGFEAGFSPDQKMPLVSRSYTSDPTTEELSAIPLYSLMTMVQDPINITETL